MNATYLLMVTPEGNHNKFYRMLPNIPDVSHFTVEWGRVGATAMKKIYSMAAWDKIYKDKIKKGYVDQSDLHDCVVTVLSSNYVPIADQLVAELVDALLDYSDNAIKKNYIVSSKDVTQAMINLAREKIDQLYSVNSLSEFNATLSQLFTIIPRKMEKVEDCLAHTEIDAAEIITREEALLDVMAGKVDQKTRHNIRNDNISNTNTILDENNLTIRPCTMDEIRHIKKFLGKESEHKLKNAFYVKNIVTEERFYDYCSKNQITDKDIHYLYHGSRNENWWNILIQGLSLRPKKSVIRTGAMFGHGLYFAPRAKKSIGYTSLSGSYWASGSSATGFLAVYKVAYKKPYKVYTHVSAYERFTKESIQQLGADAVFASKEQGMLINDEVIIYDDRQATIRYLIELA